MSPLDLTLITSPYRSAGERASALLASYSAVAKTVPIEPMPTFSITEDSKCLTGSHMAMNRK